MITTIPTKYDIGQKVYLKKTALDFSRGYFIDVEVPRSNSLHLLEFMYILIIQVFIIVSMENRNDKVFSSLEEVEAHCKHDSE